MIPPIHKTFDLNDGDGLNIRDGNDFFITCCDCNLVHYIKATKIKGGICLKFYRDKRKTAAKRRRK